MWCSSVRREKERDVSAIFTHTPYILRVYLSFLIFPSSSRRNSSEKNNNLASIIIVTNREGETRHHTHTTLWNVHRHSEVRPSVCVMRCERAECTGRSTTAIYVHLSNCSHTRRLLLKWRFILFVADSSGGLSILLGFTKKGPKKQSRERLAGWTRSRQRGVPTCVPPWMGSHRCWQAFQVEAGGLACRVVVTLPIYCRCGMCLLLCCWTSRPSTTTLFCCLHGAWAGDPGSYPPRRGACLRYLRATSVRQQLVSNPFRCSNAQVFGRFRSRTQHTQLSQQANPPPPTCCPLAHLFLEQHKSQLFLRSPATGSLPTTRAAILRSRI